MSGIVCVYEHTYVVRLHVSYVFGDTGIGSVTGFYHSFIFNTHDAHL